MHTDSKNNFIREVKPPFFRIPEEDKTDWILDKLWELQEKFFGEKYYTTFEFLVVFTKKHLNQCINETLLIRPHI